MQLNPLTGQLERGAPGTITSSAPFDGDERLLRSDGTGRAAQASCVTVLDDTWEAMHHSAEIGRRFIYVSRLISGSAANGTWGDYTHCTSSGGLASCDVSPALGPIHPAAAGGPAQDHWSGFQARPWINVNISASNPSSSFFSRPNFLGGTCGTYHHIDINNGVFGGGACGWQTGLHIRAMSGATANTPILVNGTGSTPSCHEPAWVIGVNTPGTWDTVSKLQVVGSGAITGPWQLGTYTVATVPSAASYPRGTIYVSNESGGAVPAFSDGTNWRRVTDRNVIS